MVEDDLPLVYQQEVPVARYGHLGSKQREIGNVGYRKVPLSLFSVIENRSLSSQQGPYRTSEKEMAPMAQYTPHKVAKRYGLCHAA